MNMQYEETKDIIFNAVVALLDLKEEVSDDTNLISKGLDSMLTVGLIVELEETFDIIFDDEELFTENFSTISKIVEKVNSKR